MRELPEGSLDSCKHYQHIRNIPDGWCIHWAVCTATIGFDVISVRFETPSNGRCGVLSMIPTCVLTSQLAEIHHPTRNNQPTD